MIWEQRTKIERENCCPVTFRQCCSPYHSRYKRMLKRTENVVKRELDLVKIIERQRQQFMALFAMFTERQRRVLVQNASLLFYYSSDLEKPMERTQKLQLNQGLNNIPPGYLEQLEYPQQIDARLSALFEQLNERKLGNLEQVVVSPKNHGRVSLGNRDSLVESSRDKIEISAQKSYVELQQPRSSDISTFRGLARQ